MQRRFEVRCQSCPPPSLDPLLASTHRPTDESPQNLDSNIKQLNFLGQYVTSIRNKYTYTEVRSTHVSSIETRYSSSYDTMYIISIQYNILFGPPTHPSLSTTWLHDYIPMFCPWRQNIYIYTPLSMVVIHNKHVKQTREGRINHVHWRQTWFK